MKTNQGRHFKEDIESKTDFGSFPAFKNIQEDILNISVSLKFLF